MNRQSKLLVIISFSMLPCWQIVAAPKARVGSSVVTKWAQPEAVFPGVVIVRMKPGVPPMDGMTATSLHSFKKFPSTLEGEKFVSAFRALAPGRTGEIPGETAGLSDIYYLQFDKSLDVREVARQLNGAEEVLYAEPKYVNRLFDIPNDPLGSNQTNQFTRMNAFNGWTLAKGDSTVVIADVDGGTRWTHQDLLPNLWVNPAEDINHNGRFDSGPPPGGDEDGIDQDGDGLIDDVIGWNFANNSNDPRGLVSTPLSGEHGTETASIFGARSNNGIGIAGSSWNCRLMPLCTASPTQDGYLEFPYDGIVYAYTHGAKVINCSFGRDGGYSQFEQDIIAAATQAGALVVAAAGNGTNNNAIPKDNDSIPTYPANYHYVLGVGATQATTDTKGIFSNYGVTIPVYAPGVSVYTAFTANDSNYHNAGSGTSYSTPYVSGLAGIVQSLHPTWTPRQVATQIRVTSDTIEYANGASIKGLLGHGRVNFARAFSETHPGIEILTSSIVNTRGQKLFLQGDTIVMNLSVQNILFADANNLTFAVTTSDSLALRVLQGTAVVPLLAQGNQTTLPEFRFVVGPLSITRNIVIKISWVSNANDHDAYAYKVIVFPSTPLWNVQNSPTQTSLYAVRAVSQNVVWAAGGNGSASSPVVIRTTNGGTAWSLATGNLSAIDIYCLSAVDENHAWVGTGTGKIYATTNGGSSWAEQTYPGTQSSFIDGVWFFDTSNGYALGDPAAGGQFVVLRTSDGGSSWAHLANEPVGTSTEAGWNNSFWWTDVNHGWFGTGNFRVWRTTNGGISWSSGSTGGTNQEAFGVSFKDNSNGLTVFSNGAIMVSTNGGATWTAAATPTASSLWGVVYLPATNYAWTADGAKSYRSTNNGVSWSNQSQYPFNGSIQHISFSDTLHGWAVTSNGEVIAYNPLITAVQEGSHGGNLPLRFSLGQNYPNPFNPTTIITYELPAYSRVALKVYDVLGREISTLVDAEQPRGIYNITFDASRFASGIYFYRILAVGRTTGEERLFSASKKLLLIK